MNRLKWKSIVSMLVMVALVLSMQPGQGFPLTGIESVSAATQTLSSTQLTVTVDDQFPRVLQYTWNATEAVLYGQEDAITQIRINGTLYTPAVSFSKPNGHTAQYVMSVPAINVSITTQLKVVNNALEFMVTQINDNGATKVNTFGIPNHNLLSVRSTQAGAAFAGSVMNTAVGGSGDTVLSVTGAPATNSSAQSFYYGFLSTNQLAGGIWSNAIGETSDSARLQKQTVSKSGYYRTGLWSGDWIYRANGMTSPDDELPQAKVAITADANGNGAVNWQDGAIAFRAIMNNPQGAEDIPGLVVQRVPFNFGSQATNPFTKTLDETKRMYQATDGLGQLILLKGYGSEGHDSAHPDYGVIGSRQGGATDLNTLVNVGHQYNGYFGVHINATESYPEAKAFNEQLVNKNSPGWNWLDQSYYINKRYEAASGNRLSRLQSLKSQAPNLDFIYLDVWYSKGWDARKIADEINAQGWTLTTEFPDDHEEDAVWTHWSVDYNYGGTGIKGYSSDIARFIRNHQKDNWIARHPLLGGTEMNDYEGWQGRRGFDNTVQMTFETNLPTKYMQHFEIMSWSSQTIAFANNVTVSNSSGARVLTKDGRTILTGNRYLLPWSPLTEDKLYHWNGSGGSSTWSLPASWSGQSTVKLYRLTDQGKVFISDLAVSGGNVTINALANTAYVVYKTTASAPPAMQYGEGTPLKDPGFNQGSLAGNWIEAGSGIGVNRNSYGDYELKLGSSTSASSVSQTMVGLAPGSYSASVYVSTGGGRRAHLDVSSGGATSSVYASDSLWTNYIAGDAKRNTTMQRMYVTFDVPTGESTATLTLRADSGTNVVTFDDVRVVATTKTPNPNNAYFVQHFEHVPSGLYPFVKGPAGGANDPRTHLSELSAPYTQKGWNGKAIDDVISGNWSVKAHHEAQGLLLQTLPQTIRFEPGVNYTISFNYQNETAGAYSFVVGNGTSVVSATAFPAATNTTTYTYSLTGAASGNSWFGIQKSSSASSDFVLDDLVVTIGGGGGGTLEPNQIPPSGMTASATSFQNGDDPQHAIDGDSTTLWHTKWNLSDPLPQSITLALGGTYSVNQIKYLPRQTGTNGNITGYKVLVSSNGSTFTEVASGTWLNSSAEKSASFAAVTATHVRLEATAGAGGYASAAEIKVFHAPTSSENPEIKIAKIDPRSITDLNVTLDFTVENSPHSDTEAVGAFNETSIYTLNARNGTFTNGAWRGNFIDKLSGTPGAAELTLRKLDTRPITAMTITVEFKINGDLHRDTHVIASFDGNINLTLTGQNGTLSNGVYVGDFLK